MTAALAVCGLGARTADGTVLLDGVDLDLLPGRVLAVVGPSGAGKSTLGLALLGEAATGVEPTGSVRVQGTELLGLSGGALRRARAGRVGHLPQHPGVVLDPVRRAGPVLDELAATVHGHGRAHRAARAAAVVQALDRAGLGTEPGLARRFPHQLSGGQQQRMALAQTLVTGPDVVVLDEPTTGLDPDTTGAVTGQLAALARAGTALVLLTHDLDTARRLADDVLELDGGRPARRGTAREVLGPPVAEAGSVQRPPGDPLLEVTDLSVRTAGGITLLAGVGLSVERGGCLAVVGPSGAGKTTLGRALAGLVPSDGGILVTGTRATGDHRAVQYVHQDYRSAFLDHRPVLDQVARPAELLRGLPRADARAEATALLGRLGLAPADTGRRPGGLSGGQLQRASVARALLARPSVLVTDEATSALDGRHRALLLAELARARHDDGLAVVLISHDPATVTAADRVLALADGRVVDTPAPATTG
ncbi:MULTISPECIES: ATP-binding cassette domain-containing protein [unclassified Pseudonocardia]|uniref:ABC transporter ATP-binding protein n=1 Tax=unclassified Pseudonocardia TaxID=2619320 RepID=UPI00094B48DC|nr:ATP-binding cassette domain-containing protein [Pseudonocardia sp. Ae707_Ps1]OLM20982.1 putative ATP-binding component of ABC transporter [Pseudonocardia sp. Ae707_Ps1]